MRRPISRIVPHRTGDDPAFPDGYVRNRTDADAETEKDVALIQVRP